jgi:hypothetical protein
LKDIAGAWREFSLTANRRLLERKNSACVGAPAND